MKKINFIYVCLIMLLTTYTQAQVSISGCYLSGGLSIYDACNNGQGCISGCNLALTYSYFGNQCNGASITGNCFGASGSGGEQTKSTSFILPSGCTANVVVEMKKRTGGCTNSGADAGDYIQVSGSGGSSTPATITGDNTQNSSNPVSGGNYDALITYSKVGGTFVIAMSANRSDEIATYTINLSGSCGSSCNAVLPIELIKFWGEPTENGIELLWLVDSEINLSHYMIERSIDALNFKKIADVTPQLKNEQSGKNFLYQLTDVYAQKGINYYRLTNIDRDGGSKQHPMITTDYRLKNMSSIWYSQNEEKVTFGITQQTKGFQYHIVTVSGTLVKTLNFDNGMVTINKTDIPVGLYLIYDEEKIIAPIKLFIY